MLKLLRKLKNNTGGYILVYVVLLVAFVTCLFAGMAAMISSRTKITSHNISGQQLQVTAQSALNTIVDEFEHNAPLKAKLAEYVQGSGQTAYFKLTDDTGISDDIKVTITKVAGEENKARIEVEASNSANTTAVSVAYAIIDYSVEPKGESAGVVDHLLVAYLLSGSSDTVSLSRSNFKGNVIANGKLDVFCGNNDVYLGNVIAKNDLTLRDSFIHGNPGEANGIKIGSIEGKVEVTGASRGGNDAGNTASNISLIAGQTGYKQNTNNFVWGSPTTKIITGDGGHLDIESFVGTIGSIISGGDLTLKPKVTDNIKISGDVIGMDNVKLDDTQSYRDNEKVEFCGNILSGENMEVTFQNNTTVAGNIAAVGSIKGGNNSRVSVTGGLYAGREVNLTGLKNFFAGGGVLSGANYRNGNDKIDRINSYTGGGTNKGGIVLSGSDVKYGDAVINDASGSNSVSGTGTVYKRSANESDNGAFNSKFYGLNRTWRSLMLKVEKGSDSDGYVNLAAALEPSDIGSGVKFESFINNIGDAEDKYNNGYYKVGDTFVSHHSDYTLDRNEYALSTLIKPDFAELRETFNNAIINREKAPDVIIPSELTSKWAVITYESSNKIIINRSGYIQFLNNNDVSGTNLQIRAMSNDNLGGEPDTFPINKNAKMVFDTGSETGEPINYDLLLGRETLEYCMSESNSGGICFPFDIQVEQPKKNPGYVRIFIPDGIEFYAGVSTDGTYKVENIGESNVDGNIPEVYLFYNGEKDIHFKRRQTKGFIIAPHCRLDFDLAALHSDGNTFFEGIMICDNIKVDTNATEKSYVYYKPLTYKSALTADVYDTHKSSEGNAEG